MNKKFVLHAFIIVAIYIPFFSQVIGQEMRHREVPSLAWQALSPAIKNILTSMDNKDAWELKKQELVHARTDGLNQLIQELKTKHLPLTFIHTLQGHEGAIYSAQFSPDGKLIATASADPTARIWDVTTGRLIITLKGHSDAIWAIKFSPDGKQIVTGSSDKTARIWNVQTKRILTLKGHNQLVFLTQFSPNGEQIATASNDRTTRIWDTQTGKLLHTIQRGCTCNSAQFSPNGEQVVIAYTDRTAQIYNTHTGTLIHTLKGHTDEILSGQFSPDGKKIVTRSADKTARIWNVQTGTLIHTLKGHTELLTSALFSPDSKQIVTTSLDNTTQIWDTDSGKRICKLTSYDSFLKSAQFSLDSEQLVTVDDTVRIWNARTGARLNTLGTIEKKPNVQSFAQLSPDGWQILIVDYKTVQIWSRGYYQIDNPKADQAGPAQVAPLDGSTGQEFLQLLLQAKLHVLDTSRYERHHTALDPHALAHLSAIWSKLPAEGREQLEEDYLRINCAGALKPAS